MLRVNEDGVLKTVSDSHWYLYSYTSGYAVNTSPDAYVLSGIQAPCRIITFFIAPYSSGAITVGKCEMVFQGSTIENRVSPLGQGGWVYVRVAASSDGSGSLSYYKTGGSQVCGAFSLLLKNIP